MKQKLLIVLSLALLILLLAGLNAATYVQKQKVPDTEFAANRSSHNPGSTGTQAFYTLLVETGRKVTRWQTSLETIASETKNKPAVLVMAGPMRRELTDDEDVQLMKWVGDGGTLVLIDREPASRLAATTANWHMSVRTSADPDIVSVDSADQKQMTAGTAAVKPLLPFYFSRGVNSVQPSRFASDIELERYDNPASAGTSVRAEPAGPPVSSGPTGSETPFDFYGESRFPDDDGEEEEGPAAGSDTGPALQIAEKPPSFEVPLVHLGTAETNLLVEAPFSKGRIVILSDPFIVSNAGINLVDNSRLAINLVTQTDGLIAFDEYHHGYGANNNRLFQYFEGTPVIALFVQCGLLVALIFFSQSRRFGRPVPEPEPSRLSKLEYVSAMAELQQRTRAYDLAIENIYSDFRRRVSSLLGLDNTTTGRRVIAEGIAERTAGDPRAVYDLLQRCEDAIHGEPIRRKETVELIEKLRTIEEQLGLKRSSKRGL